MTIIIPQRVDGPYCSAYAPVSPACMMPFRLADRDRAGRPDCGGGIGSPVLDAITQLLVAESQGSRAIGGASDRRMREAVITLKEEAMTNSIAARERGLAARYLRHGVHKISRSLGVPCRSVRTF
jgi:hypothetical protein